MPRIKDGAALAARGSATGVASTTLSNSNLDNYTFEASRLIATVALISTQKLVVVDYLLWISCAAGTQNFKLRISLVTPTATYSAEFTFQATTSVQRFIDKVYFSLPDWGPSTVKMEITPTGSLTSALTYSKFVCDAQDDRTIL
jgi:hypothetical protein